jgi:hypothetical protein
MAPRPEDRVTAWFDAFADADRDAYLSLIHPGAQMWLPRAALEGGEPYRGIDGAGRAWDDAFDVWERFEYEPRELDAIGGVLIVGVLVRCFPRREGPTVEYLGYNVTELRDAKIVYWRPYLERAEAQADAEARSKAPSE